jgi:transposase
LGHGRTDEFRKHAVRIVLTSGLTRKQVTDDLGVGMSTLSQADVGAVISVTASYTDGKD